MKRYSNAYKLIIILACAMLSLFTYHAVTLSSPAFAAVELTIGFGSLFILGMAPEYDLYTKEHQHQMKLDEFRRAKELRDLM
jgi:hypothetical protein